MFKDVSYKKFDHCTMSLAYFTILAMSAQNSMTAPQNQ